LLRVRDGRLVVDAKFSATLREAGLVSGAVFSDLTGDGQPELVLACEWGPLRVFQFANGSLVEKTGDLGLSPHRGWWQSVTTADVDADGRMDIVAGNWGLNSSYHAAQTHPVRLYCGDFNDDGTTALLEVQHEAKRDNWLSRRNWRQVSEAMPFILERISSYRAFSESGAEEVLGTRFARARAFEASTLASTVFLNRGDRFEAVALPTEAQLSPVFGISVADFDGDGSEDLVLAQNFFDLPSEAGRLDAGRGLLLRGQGNGRFEAVGADKSGLKVYGEQRGCAVADFDTDGRADVVLTQNGEATCIFRNIGASPGLRVRLRGGEGNPLAAGAVMRLGKEGKFGAAREIHLGSGYWSQDSVVQVLAAPAGSQLQVRWPGGKVTATDIPAAAKDVEIGPNGALKVLR
jgi:hypothetical protein